MYGLTLQTAATSEPVTLGDAKRRCRIGDSVSYHDAELTTAIASSRDWVERYCNRQLVTATWDFQFDKFPCGLDPINCPRTPLASVTSITYLAAADGASTVWSSANYRVITSTEPGYIVPAYEVTYPATRDIAGAITVRFVAGAAVASVPAFLKQFILSDVVASFEGRQEEFRGNEQVMQSLEAYRVADDFIRYEREALETVY